MSPPPLTRARACRAVAIMAAMAIVSLLGSATLRSSSSQDASHLPSSGHRLLRNLKGISSDAAKKAVAIATSKTSAIHLSAVQARVPGDEDDAVPWWKDIDYDVQVPCGVDKCFYPSVTDPSRGYLVRGEKLPRTGTVSSPAYRFAMGAYSYEKELESTHGVRGFYTAPPYLMRTPSYFREHGHKKGAGKSSHVAASRYVVVQNERTMPEGSFLVKCTGNDNDSAPSALWMERYPLFDENAGRTLGAELGNLKSLVANHPELTFDFQFVVDQEGRIYHIDLSRAMQNLGTMRRRGYVLTCIDTMIADVASLQAE